ncbi:MAG: hypothetical protein OXF67_02460 [Cyanobacteria bacterium MAG CAR4_bin_6]|nr:hypothetical protein [Cyanobacteria bacterium MAG CAR4_bin_6]
MPTLPPELTEWLPSGFFTALLGLLWYELKAGEARFNKRMDELREELKASEARQQEELKASEARQREELKVMDARQREELKVMDAHWREDMKAMDARHREDMKELRDKVDALPSKIMELLRTANQPVAPER